MQRFLLALCALFSSCLFAEIKEISQISALEDAMGPLKSSDLLLLDIDYTLVEPTHPVLQMGVIKQNKYRFLKELAKFAGEQKDLIPALMVTQTPGQLTDPSLPNLIQKFQDQKIPVLGFTSLDTSVIPQIGSIPDWREKELERLGIRFQSNQEEIIELTELSPFRGTFPLYRKGILYCNVVPSKGAVLSAFLDRTGRKPSRVIFVDDMRENLQSVEAEMGKRGIPFLGIHYKADATKLCKISDEEWDLLWEKIRDRAISTVPLEGILQTANVAAIQWALQQMPRDSLAIFDVGNVLLTHKDAILAFQHRPWIQEWFGREAPEVDDSSWRELSGVIDREAKMNLVHPMLPSLIQEAKKRTTVIALSKFWCGPSGENSSFEEHRIALLKNRGLDLGEPFPKASVWRSKETTYSNGLIQTEASLKGPVLKAFLHHVGWKPKAILFIDDRRDQCESIATAAKELGIPALCVHYTEATNHTPPLDPAIADLQLRTLVQEKRWISDEIARTKLPPPHQPLQ